MSRVANSPVALPKGVDIKIEGLNLSVKGGKGTLDLTLTDGVGVNVEEDVATIGIIENAIDPTSFDQASAAYFGYNAEKPPVPETLDSDQQAYVDELIASFFVAPQSLEPGSEAEGADGIDVALDVERALTFSSLDQTAFGTG